MHECLIWQQDKGVMQIGSVMGSHQTQPQHLMTPVMS